MTVAELSALLHQIGADDGMNLDGGGSSTFAVRGPGEPATTVRNTPADGSERAVANGIGVFALP
jgi:exopolysaccharide biosynthesis protein